MLGFTIGLTRWVARSRFSVFWWFVMIALVLLEIFLLELEIVWPPLMLLLLPEIFVLFRARFTPRLSLRHRLHLWTGFFQWWQVGFGFSGFCCVACCVTVFIRSWSAASKPWSSNSFLRCDTICSCVLFSKCASLINFFRWGGILAYMNCSMIVWATTPNASFGSFWSSFWKPNLFWFAALGPVVQIGVLL